MPKPLGPKVWDDSDCLNWQCGDDHQKLTSEGEGSILFGKTTQDVFAEQAGSVRSCTAMAKCLLSLISASILHLHTQKRKS